VRPERAHHTDVGRSEVEPAEERDADLDREAFGRRGREPACHRTESHAVDLAGGEPREDVVDQGRPRSGVCERAQQSAQPLGRRLPHRVDDEVDDLGAVGSAVVAQRTVHGTRGPPQAVRARPLVGKIDLLREPSGGIEARGGELVDRRGGGQPREIIAHGTRW
jgi:hypothetical protein